MIEKMDADRLLPLITAPFPLIDKIPLLEFATEMGPVLEPVLLDTREIVLDGRFSVRFMPVATSGFSAATAVRSVHVPLADVYPTSPVSTVGR